MHVKWMEQRRDLGAFKVLVMQPAMQAMGRGLGRREGEIWGVHWGRLTRCLLLPGGDTLRLEQLLEWWKEKNAGFCSRLILVLDDENAGPWVREVRKVDELYVAVQGAELTRLRDVEEAELPQLGDFTARWVEYNCNPESDICWSEGSGGVLAIYGVSMRWGDYTLHLPTGSDVTKHWKTYFPRATFPLVHLANWCGGLNLFWVCDVCLRCFRRLKLSWFPPSVLDTGQGFKLVKS